MDAKQLYLFPMVKEEAQLTIQLLDDQLNTSQDSHRFWVKRNKDIASVIQKHIAEMQDYQDRLVEFVQMCNKKERS